MFLLFFVHVYSSVVCAKDDGILLDSDLVKKIIEGHQTLEQSTKYLSGQIVRVKKNVDGANSNTSQRHQPRQYYFYKNSDQVRLEYIQPQQDTQIATGHKYNDITEIILRTDNFDYLYSAIPSTGLPFANLTRSKIPNDIIDIRIKTDLFRNIGALTALPTLKVIEVLQKPVGKIEYKPYEGFTNAIWISGVEQTSKGQSGESEFSNWQIVLNSHEHYALLNYSLYGKDAIGNVIMQIDVKIASQNIADYVIVPKEIVYESYFNFLAKDQKRSAEQTTINIFSTEMLDEKLFSEDSFKEAGRNYVIVDESPSGVRAANQIIHAAPLPPLESRMPSVDNSYVPSPMMQLVRIVLIAIGLILLLLALLSVFWKSIKNKR
jgi:hypothetical protein